MTDPIIDRLDQIKGRADKATEGPWEHYSDGDHEVYQAVEYDDGDLGGYITWSVPVRADAEFIAAARTDVPQMEQALRAVLESCDRAISFPTPDGEMRQAGIAMRETAEIIRDEIAVALGVESEGEEK